MFSFLNKVFASLFSSADLGQVHVEHHCKAVLRQREPGRGSVLTETSLLAPKLWQHRGISNMENVFFWPPSTMRDWMKRKIPTTGYLEVQIWGKLGSTYCWLVSANKWSRLYENESNYSYFPVSCSVQGSRLQWMGLFPSFHLPWCDRIGAGKWSNIKIKRETREEGLLFSKKPKEQMHKISVRVLLFMIKWKHNYAWIRLFSGAFTVIT